MEVVDYTLHSEELDRDFDVTVYGGSGWPVIVFPEGDSTCTSWENGGLVDAIAPLLNAGKAQLFCVDSMDDEGWYARSTLPEYRIENIHAYFDFVRKDFVPFVVQHSLSERAPLLAGVGIGALNATVTLLSDPTPFGGLLAVSGNYDVRNFLDGEPDEEWLGVSPVDLAKSLDDGKSDGKLRAIKRIPVAFVCGQHASEDGIASQRAMDEAFSAADAGATFEYWGYDVSHDWVWWAEEVRQLLPCLLKPTGLQDRKLVAELSAAQAQVDHAASRLGNASEQLERAKVASQEATKGEASARERLQKESAQVKACAAREEELAEAARKAWEKRDEAARVLDEATRAGNEAQAKADAAKAEREKAEWIEGEARSGAERASDEARKAAEQLDGLEDAVRDAQAAKDRADAMFAQVKAAVDAEKSAAEAAAESAEQTAPAAEPADSAKAAPAAEPDNPTKAAPAEKTQSQSKGNGTQSAGSSRKGDATKSTRGTKSSGAKKNTRSRAATRSNASNQSNKPAAGRAAQKSAARGRTKKSGGPASGSSSK